MPPSGSADVAVKAASPERGRSEAKSLDSAAASPTMETVMARTNPALGCDGRRSRSPRRCGWSARRLTHRTDLRSEPPRCGLSHSVRRQSSAWARWPKAVLALLKEGAERATLERQDHDQWTVVKRRLAARSSVNRPSCQGVR